MAGSSTTVNILVGATYDASFTNLESEIISKLNSISNKVPKIKIQFDTKSIQQAINDLSSALATIEQAMTRGVSTTKSSASIKELTTATNELTKATEKYGTASKNANSGSENYTGKIKASKSTYEQYTKTLKEATSALEKYSAAEKSSSPETRAAYGDIKTQVDNLKQYYTELQNGVIEEEDFIKSVKESQNIISQAAAQIETTSDAYNRNAEVVRENAQAQKEIASAVKEAQSSLQAYASAQQSSNEAVSEAYASYENAISGLNELNTALGNGSMSADEARDKMSQYQTQIDSAKVELDGFIQEQEQVAQVQSEIASALQEAQSGLQAYSSAQQSSNEAAQQAYSSYENAINGLNELNTALSNESISTDEARDKMSQYQTQIDSAKVELDGYIKAEEEAAQAAREAAQAQKDGEAAMRSSTSAIKNAQNMLTRYSAAANSSSEETRQAYKGIEQELQNLNNLQEQYANHEITGTYFKEEVQKSTEQLRAYEKQIMSTGDATKSLGDRFTNLASKFTMWFSASQAIMLVVRSMKELVSQSIELDSAMAQLKIVTDETDETYKQFSDDIAKTAQDIGASITDLVDSTTTYARLGYNLEESSTLAEYTSMLKNVGDIDVSEAQESITSMVKAFDVGVDDIEEVMDKLVVVGNNFPISVSEISEGMTNASSTLAAAGNSLEESIALLTAANTTIQNVSKSSTGLRTIVARLRNTTTELDDLGEEMTTAQYEELISALTDANVALTDANGEFRSTYDIMRDIAYQWDDLTTMEQSALAKTISGTRQQAVFYSLVEQFQEAEGAMDAMSDSAGTLTESYDIYMDTTQRHIDSFKAAFQNLGSDLFQSDFMNQIIDLGTKIVNIIDKVVELINTLGGLPTVLGVVGAAIVGLNLDSIKNKIMGIVQSLKDIPNTISNIASKFANFGSGAASTAGTSLGYAASDATRWTYEVMDASASGAEVASATAKTAAKNAESAAVAAEGASAAAESAGAAAEGATAAAKGSATAAKSASTAAEGATAAANGAAAASEGVTAAASGATTATVAISGSAIAATAAFAGLAAAAIAFVAAYEYVEHAHTRAQAAAEEELAEYKEVKSELDSLNSEYEENESRIKELNALKTDGSISLAQEAELQQLQSQNAELATQLKYEEAIAELKAQGAATAVTESANTGTSYSEYLEETQNQGRFKTLINELAQGFGMSYSYYSGYESDIEKYNKSYYETGSAIGYVIDQLNEYKEAMDEAQEAVYQDPANKSAQKTYEQAKDNFEGTLSYLEAQEEEIESWIEAWELVGDDESIEKWTGQLKEIQNAIMDLTMEPAEKQAQEISDYFKEIDTDNSMTEALSQAAAEGEDLIPILEELGVDWQNIADDVDEDAIEKYFKTASDSAEDASKVIKDSFKSIYDGLPSEGVPVSYQLILDDWYASLNDWYDSLPEEDQELAYEVYLENDTARWSLQQWEDAVAEAKENSILSFSIDLDAETESLDNLNSALSESASASGLTSEAIANLESRYKDLDSYDPSKLFENTAEGVHLNREELQNLEAEYDNYINNGLVAKLDTEIQKYEEAKEKLANLDEGTAEYYSTLNDVNSYESQISATERLISQYEGLTSAYGKWQDALSSTNANSEFESIGSSYEDMQAILEQGWYGNDDLNAYLDLILSADARTGDVVADFEKLTQTIDGTSHSIMDYFTWEDGNLVTDGLYDFLDDVNAIFGDTYAGINEAGYYFDFSGDKLQEVADRFGINVEYLEIIEKALSEAGMNVVMGDGAIESLKSFAQGAEEAAKAVEELAGTDLKIDFDADISGLEDQISQVQELFDQYVNEDGTINVDAEGYDEVSSVLAALILQKQELAKEESLVLSVDVDSCEGEFATVIELVQSLQDKCDEVELLESFHEDTSAAEAEIANIILELNSIENEDIRLALGLDDEEFQSVIAQIDNEEVDLDAGVELEDGSVETIKSEISNIDLDELTVACNTEGAEKDINSLEGETEPVVVDVDVQDEEYEAVKEDISSFRNECIENPIPLAIEMQYGDVQGTADVEDQTATVEIDADTSGFTEGMNEVKEEKNELLYDQPYVPSVQIDNSEALGSIEEVKEGEESLDTQQLIPLKADNSEAVESIEEVNTVAESVKQSILMRIFGNNSDAKESLEEVEKKSEEVTSKDKEVKVTGNDQNFLQTIREVENTNPSDKSLTVSAVDRASGTINEIKSLLNSLNDKTVTVTTRNVTQNVSMTTMANGTAHERGTANASGNWSVGKAERALMGELGQEMVVRDGNYFTVGDNGAEFVDLKPNDIVFNHEQTEALLHSGYVQGRGLVVGGAFEQGSAYDIGSNGQRRKSSSSSSTTTTTTTTKTTTTSSGSSSNASSKSSSTSSSKSSSTSSTSSDDFDETFDWIEIKIDRIERAIDSLDLTLNSTYKTWSTRNKALSDELSDIAEEISIQQQGYDRYIQEANSVGLSSSYAERVRNGTIDISTITDEDLANKIKSYQEWWKFSCHLIHFIAGNSPQPHFATTWLEMASVNAARVLNSTAS